MKKIQLLQRQQYDSNFSIKSKHQKNAVNVLKHFYYVDVLYINLMVLLNCITTTDDKVHKAHKKLISKTLIWI